MPSLRPEKLSEDLWATCPVAGARVVFWEGWLVFETFEIPFVSSSLGQYFLWWEADRDVNGRQEFRGFVLKWRRLWAGQGASEKKNWPDFQIRDWPGIEAFEREGNPADRLWAKIDGQGNALDLSVTLPKGSPVEEAKVWQDRKGFYLFPEPRKGIRLVYGEAVVQVEPPPYWVGYDVEQALGHWAYNRDKDWRPEGEGRVDPVQALAQLAVAKREFARKVLEAAGLTSLPPPPTPKKGGIMGGGLEFD